MEKRSHVEVSTDEQILILRSYAKNRSNWPQIYREVKTAVLENSTDKVKLLYSEKSYEKIKRRMADQVHKLMHKNEGLIESDELRNLVMSVKDSTSRYSIKEHPIERKRKFQIAKKLQLNQRQDEDGGCPQSSTSVADEGTVPSGAGRPPPTCTSLRPLPAVEDRTAPPVRPPPTSRKLLPAVEDGAAPPGRPPPTCRRPLPAVEDGEAPPRRPLPRRPLPAVEDGEAPPRRPLPRRPLPAVEDGEAPPGRPPPTCRRPLPAVDGAAPPGRPPPACRRPLPAVEDGAAPPGRPPPRRTLPAAEVDEGEAHRRRAIPIDSDSDDEQEEPPKKKTTSQLAREAYEVYLSSAERSRRLEMKMEQCMDKFLSM